MEAIRDGGERERERSFPLERSTSLEYYFWYSRTVLVTYDDERVARRRADEEREKERAKGACTVTPFLIVCTRSRVCNRERERKRDVSRINDSGLPKATKGVGRKKRYEGDTRRDGIADG